MNLKDADLVKNAKLISIQLEHLTCFQCCKYYLAPKTAPCGHTLCHICWRERLTCPICAKSIVHSTLRQNQTIEKHKKNVLAMGEAFEKLFNVKVAEVLLQAESDPTKTVTDWLASSQNHFSDPPSEKLSLEIQNPLNVSSNKIQIHTNTTKQKNKNPEPAMPIIVQKIPQDDWDKIELMPDSEDVSKKEKENVIGPMDIEPFYINDENQYTANNPRRSSRKRDLKPSSNVSNDKVLVKQNSNHSSEEADKKSSIAKQNWNNVKRMRKEFSKLNKKNRNKLNISIEMCKKTQTVGKPCDALPQMPLAQYDIDENTPNYDVHPENLPERQHSNIDDDKSEVVPDIDTKNSNTFSNDENQIRTAQKTSKHSVDGNHNKSNTKDNASQIIAYSSGDESKKHVASKIMPFYKLSSLNPNFVETNVSKTVKHIVESDNNSNDDIEITIKVGSTIANIIVKKKNDMQLKINSDREIQTSPNPHEMNEKEKTSTPINSQSQNIVINIGDNNEIDVRHQPSNPRVEELKKLTSSDKISSVKKNTDSADTATAQFEITDSVEKELSKIMEVDMNEPESAKTITTIKSSKTELQKTANILVENKKTNSSDDIANLKKTNILSQKAPSNIDVNEYINDIDIFDSEPVKEQSVQYLKNTGPAVSEILLCTAKTKNKSQRTFQKRCRVGNETDVLPKSKKAKGNNEAKVSLNETAEGSAPNQPDSEPISYDAIMGTVFANIDAEIGESQNVIKNTYTLEDKSSQNKNLKVTQVKMTEGKELLTNVEDNASQLSKRNQKESENIFSTCAEKDRSEVTVPLACLGEKTAENQSTSVLPEFLTPGTAQVVDDVRMSADDSDDKSVVEETPQKSSFTKAKQKSNGANRETSQSQTLKLINKEPSKASTVDINTLVSVTDTSLKSNANETAIENPKQIQTPLTINKFVNQIQYKSTPCAKKSLSFDSPADDITICPIEGVVNTTQEREFMLKAFEKTPTTVVKPSLNKSLALRHKRYVIAGSCLGNAELATLKRLCARNKWTYENKYTEELTHLVVKVDEENKAQRSIKYMCALAASKWIVSYEWVAKCLQSKDSVSEEEFEVLDSTGHPGPMRSRIASKKLFKGIKFFCLGPFGVLDGDTLKNLISSAGGTVVEQMAAISVTEQSPGPALLLAEPENTQEDKFIYLAMKMTLVPVNHEWVLNCLGSYSLNSIQDLLLCPASLLPKATERWPQKLLAYNEDGD